MPRKPRVNTSGRKPGRPVSSVRTSDSFYIKKTVLSALRKRAKELGKPHTKSSIVEKLIEADFGLAEED